MLKQNTASKINCIAESTKSFCCSVNSTGFILFIWHSGILHPFKPPRNIRWHQGHGHGLVPIFPVCKTREFSSSPAPYLWSAPRFSSCSFTILNLCASHRSDCPSVQYSFLLLCWRYTITCVSYMLVATQGCFHIPWPKFLTLGERCPKTSCSLMNQSVRLSYLVPQPWPAILKTIFGTCPQSSSIPNVI